MKERQELWCHDCQKYVQFDIDVALNGNHVIICPNCGHEHCRVVENGKVTDIRWDSRNAGGWTGSTHMTTGMTATNASTYAVYTANTMTDSSASSAITYGAWMNLITYS